MKLFEIASRKKYRFDSVKGELTVEQLWDLPLTSRTAFDLDNVARHINAELLSVSEGSFVQTTVNPRKFELEEKLELVKHVIKVRIEENAAKLAAAARKDEIRKLEDILSRKKDDALGAMAPEEIEKRLNELRAVPA